MIPITRPFFDEREKKALNEVLDSGWLVQGPRVRLFEEKVAGYLGVPHSVAVSSCTTALHLALLVAGVKPRDEVILPSFTYVATANAVEYVGAQPVFVDIDPCTFNLDAAGIEDRFTPRTRAIIPVHLFGLCADIHPVLDMARKRGVSVIEDAACAMGSRLGAGFAGTFGDLGCFSFHPRKIITTGEGGMVTTGDSDFAARLRVLRNHGASSSDHDRHKRSELLQPGFEDLGFNYRMSDLHAAIGIEQMQKIDMIIDARRALAERYHQCLRNIPGLVLPVEPRGYFHTYQSYVLRVNSQARVDRNGLVRRLRVMGVAATQGTHAVHTLGFYRNKYELFPEAFPESLRAQEETLTLPLFPGMTVADQDRVVGALLEILCGTSNPCVE